jgi:hypothetical protein
MKPLDPRSFLADTLKPYATGGKPGLPSIFERYLLEPDDAANDEIEARLKQVKAIWSKGFEHPRYGLLAKQLAKEHVDKDVELLLLDPSERKRLAKAEREQDAKATEAAGRALEDWRKLVAEYAAQGGLTPNNRATLESLAVQQQLAPDLVRRELDALPAAAPPGMLSDDVRKVIRTTLQSLAREEREERLGLSLYHALGLEGITEDLGVVKAAYDRTLKETGARAYGQSATNYKSMLAQVKERLLDTDPRAYLEGLKHDVADDMAFEAAQATSDGEIDPTEAESLLRSALTRGLNTDLGRQVITELARRNGAVVQASARVDYVACPRCNTPHPRPDAPDKCKRCAAPLFVVCPRDGCGTRNDATALRCSNCETDLLQYTTARRRLEALPEALRDGRIAWASDEVREIATVLGADAVPGDLRASIEDALRQALTGWAEVEATIAASRLYAARARLRALVQSAPDVLAPGTHESPIMRSKEVDRRLAEVDAALVRARAATGSGREAALVEALALASDCREAEQALAAIPPLAPGRVSASLQSSGVTIRWDASRTGGAQYAVQRVDEFSGASHDLGVTRALHCEDRDVPSGSMVRYLVATVRGTARSEATRSTGVLVAREVQGLSVADLDGEVRLTWSAVPSTGRVLVSRRTEGSEQRAELVADRTGLVDREVTNGERYAYRVVVEYSAAGAAPKHTAGLTVYGQPAAPPEGIEDVGVRDVPGGVLVTFPRPVSGTVSILRCDKEPGVTTGESLDPGILSSLGSELAVGADGARDTISGGVRWYLPVTVAGGAAVAGRAVRHLALAPVTNVKAEQASGRAKITWEWPDNVRLARVLWRHDQQPARIDEPGTEAAWVRKGEYLDNGGFTIESTAGQSVFVAVVSGLLVDGERIAGTVITKSARAAARKTTRTQVRYSVRRAGLRKRRLEVEVDLPVGTAAPAMVLVARGGDLLPRTSGEGQELARFGGDQPLNATIDISARERPITVRMFLATTSASNAFQLTDPGIDDLLIR